jgi:hypothetical protein
MIRNRELDWRQRQKTEGNLADLSDGVPGGYRMTYILKGEVRGR